MDKNSIISFASSKNFGEIADLIRKDLDVWSPLVGSNGPTGPGPEEPYAQAIESDSGLQDKFGKAVNTVLMGEVDTASAEEKFPHPMLVFNLLVLLRNVKLPKARPAIAAMRMMPGILAAALAERDADLYADLLYALAVNQENGEEFEFWRSLLGSPQWRYVGAAVVGLRNCGWEKAVTTLPEVKKAIQQHPELPSFRAAVMLLIDENPMANWPQCAARYLKGSEGASIRALLQELSPGRYEVSLDKIDAVPGTVLDDYQRRMSAKKVSRSAGQNWQENCSSPLSPARSRPYPTPEARPGVGILTLGDLRQGEKGGIHEGKPARKYGPPCGSGQRGYWPQPIAEKRYNNVGHELWSCLKDVFCFAKLKKGSLQSEPMWSHNRYNYV